MYKKVKLASIISTLILSATAYSAEMTVGFSQIGSESGWRAAETSVAKSEAQKRGIILKIADAQQKQENQIKAIRSFIAQGVDAIFIAPVVQTGWEPVLQEAKEAEIPVFLLEMGSHLIPGAHDMIAASFHHSEPSPRSGMSSDETAKVARIDTTEVIQTSSVSGRSKSMSSECVCLARVIAELAT